MQIIIIVSLLSGVMLLIGLYINGRSHVMASISREAFPSIPSSNDPITFPKVVMIIPVTGRKPGMKTGLKSLLNQDYPNYEVFFVTRDMEDPASNMIQGLLSEKTQARQILSGPAVHCGQKNHNLLAGIAAAESFVEIFVFCDSTHRAPPDLLHRLTNPIIQGQAVMTTGFHRIVPGDHHLATLGMLWTVLGIHLLQGIPMFTQPWGGATAISRSLFETHGVGQLWARTAVDDFSMGPHLRKRGVRCTPVPTACLDTPLAKQTFSEWNKWLTRQLLYLKFYTPGAWLAASFGVYLIIGPFLWTGISIIGIQSGVFHWNMFWTCCGFLGLFTLIGLGFRRLIPNPSPPRIPWIMSFYFILFMTSWCYIKTWFTNTLKWKGIFYRIAWGGRVKGIHFKTE